MIRGVRWGLMVWLSGCGCSPPGTYDFEWDAYPPDATDAADAGDADGDADDIGECIDDPVPATQSSLASVRFVFSGPESRSVVTEGTFCSAMTIVSLGDDSFGEEGLRAVRLQEPYAPACEGAQPFASVDAVQPVSAGPELTWSGESLVLYYTCVNCADRDWPDLGWGADVHSVPTAAGPGSYRASFRIVDTATGSQGWAEIGPEATGQLCPGEAMVTVDFELPESGEIVVPVVVPEA